MQKRSADGAVARHWPLRQSRSAQISVIAQKVVVLAVPLAAAVHVRLRAVLAPVGAGIVGCEHAADWCGQRQVALTRAAVAIRCTLLADNAALLADGAAAVDVGRVKQEV